MGMRRALARRTGITERELAAYLPGNYEIVRRINADVIEIAGSDVAGWTLDEYVIPRLGSGLIGCDEITD